jgi:ABC-2 type transport system permease protein
MSRVGLALRLGLREYRRTPILLEILIAAPADVIVLFSLITPATEVTLSLASGATVTTTHTALTGVWMTPVAGAIIGGITGLFVMQMTREADERLVVAGYRARQVVLARLGMLGTIGLLVTVVATLTLVVMGVLLMDFTPAQLGWFALATVFATLIYGMIGVLVGTVLDTLSGVFLLLFVPLVDLFLYQDPVTPEPVAIAPYLPGHFPLRLVMNAAFTESISVTPVVGSLVWLAVVTALATAAFSRSLHTTA